uniref:Uncharacterized protein n=1 Tax=Rhodnius prolixus TaxID=13249 RepID=T1HM24_RHOPR
MFGAQVTAETASIKESELPPKSTSVFGLHRAKIMEKVRRDMRKHCSRKTDCQPKDTSLVQSHAKYKHLIKKCLSSFDPQGDTAIDYYQKIQKILNLLLSYYRNYKTQVEYDVLSDHARGLALRTLLKGLHEPIGSILKAKNPRDLNTALSMLTNDFQYNITNKQSIFQPCNHTQRPKTFQSQRPRFPNQQSFTPKPTYVNQRPFTPRLPQIEAPKTRIQQQIPQSAQYTGTQLRQQYVPYRQPACTPVTFTLNHPLTVTPLEQYEETTTTETDELIDELIKKALIEQGCSTPETSQQPEDTESIAVNVDTTEDPVDPDPEVPILEDVDNTIHTNYDGNTSLTIPIMDAPINFSNHQLIVTLVKTNPNPPKVTKLFGTKTRIYAEFAEQNLGADIINFIKEYLPLRTKYGLYFETDFYNQFAAIVATHFTDDTVSRSTDKSS